jgi:thiamine-phosphate pyrophosphorylase
MQFELPRVYPLTDVQLSGLSHSEQVRRLAAGGASLVQLREKKLSGKSFYEAALEAIEVARELSVKLIINDRVDVAVAVGADGVHLGQDDLPPTAARELLGDSAIIGYSTHNIAQAKAALDLPVDYIAIGPIFETSSKEDTEPVIGLEGLRRVRTLLGTKPLVAIGGISLGNLAEVLGSGANSVAVISALLTEPANITKKTHQLFNCLHL